MSTLRDLYVYTYWYSRLITCDRSIIEQYNSLLWHVRTYGHCYALGEIHAILTITHERANKRME